MKGKLLKVFGNDLHGTVDERVVIFFAAFNHKKYANKYGIFIFKDDINSNKLYFGSIHIKDKSLVTFSIKKEQEAIIDSFLNEYTKNNFQEFELIDISNLDKIELVGYNEKEYNGIVNLYNISIPKVEPKSEKNEKKNSMIGLIVALLITIVCFFGIYWYFHPRMFNPLILNCSITGADDTIIANYTKNKTITFNSKDMIKEIKAIDTYNFKSQNNYFNFKNESKHYLYFDNIESYQYIDETQELILNYKETSKYTTYDEIKVSLEKEGYVCTNE